MKWSDVPFAIEVRRDGTEQAWTTVARVRSLKLAVSSAANLWTEIYERMEGASLRVVEVDGNRRRVLWEPPNRLPMRGSVR